MSVEEWWSEFSNHSEWWFASRVDIDKYLCDKYSDEYTSINILDTQHAIRSKLLFAIYIDQHGRHLKRYSPQILSEDKFKSHFDKIYSFAKSLDFTEMMKILDSKDKILILIFTLLIIRHNRTEDDCNYVISKIRMMMDTSLVGFSTNNNKEILSRFLVGSITASADIVKAKESLPRTGFEFVDGYLDEACNKWSGNKIYDWMFDTTRVKEWFADEDIQRMQALVSKHTSYRPFFVSLSCGIDSSLLLFASTGLANFRGCVHINYKNRSTSDSEEELCRIMCDNLNIPLFVRQITELKREDTHVNNRAFYERITKKMRFNAYRTALDSLEGREKGKGVILLGHNKDDVTENIITNIKSSTHFDNLSGMEYESIDDNVTIIRPFLDVSKDEITRIVIRQDIPFVWNSTPTWSMRGKIRETFVPFVNKFDDEIIPGLHNLSKEMKGMYTLASKYIDNNYRYSHIGTNTDDVQKLEITSPEFVNVFFAWRYLFSKLKIKISHKSINNLISRFENIKPGNIIILSPKYNLRKIDDTHINIIDNP